MRLYKSKSYRGRVQEGGIHDVIRKKIEERRKSIEAGNNRGSFRSRISHRYGSGSNVRYEQSSSARDIKSFQFLAHNQQCVDQAGEAKCARLKSAGYCSTHLVTKEVDCRKTCGLCWAPQQTLVFSIYKYRFFCSFYLRFIQDLFAKIRIGNFRVIAYRLFGFN